MSTPLVKVPTHALNARHSFGFLDDFDHIVTADRWTIAADTGGSQAVAAGAGGVLAIATDGDDNDEAYVSTTTEMFLFAENKPIEAEVRAQFTEAATNDANILIGFADAIAADTLVDDGAGPKTTMSGFGFFKEDGETLWSIYASLSTTQTKVQLTAANSLDGIAKTAGTTAYQRLKMEFVPRTSALAQLYYYIDGVHVYTVTDFTYTSATEMDFGFGAKAGGANAETLNIDYAWAYQVR